MPIHTDTPHMEDYIDSRWMSLRHEVGEIAVAEAQRVFDHELPGNEWSPDQWDAYLDEVRGGHANDLMARAYRLIPAGISNPKASLMLLHPRFSRDLDELVDYYLSTYEAEMASLSFPHRYDLRFDRYED